MYCTIPDDDESVRPPSALLFLDLDSDLIEQGQCPLTGAAHSMGCRAKPLIYSL